LNAIAEPTASTPAAPRTYLREPHPSFPGSVGSEALKLARQGMLWAMLGLALFFFAMLTAALLQAGNVKDQLDQHPGAFLFNLYDIYTAIFDAGSGIFLLIVSARLVGMEYSAGTIRVLLARGAGRLRLLLAKLIALGLLGLVLLAGFLVLVSAAIYGVVVAWEGSFSKISSLPGTAWTDLGIVLLVMLTSMGVCILIGTAAATLGRSLAFGIGAALAFFPIDNFGTALLHALNLLTGWHFWLDITAYLLGPNLNALPVLMEKDHVAHAAFATPLVTVDATHAWLVIGAWSLGLIALTVGLTWRRDVLQ
jgi:ABC-type transport system involved in multi-copper enzyme maturation permease subunit